MNSKYKIIKILICLLVIMICILTACIIIIKNHNVNDEDVIKFKEKVYNTIIPRLVRLTEAPSHGEPIVAYDPKSRGSEAYINLAKEVIERNEGNGNK